MKKTGIVTLLLLLSTQACADPPKRVAFIFSSFRDTTAKDPIDKKSTWRNAAGTYQAIRELGVPKEYITILYNDKNPDKQDNSIALKGEIDEMPLLEGTYEKLEQAFREKTKNLNRGDEVILSILSHGGDDGVLYPDYGENISGLQLSMLINTTKAKTAAFYSACNSETLLDRSVARYAAQVSATNRTHLSWSDRNYCSNADFFSAFTTRAADTDKNGKVSFEEAVAYTSKKWRTYKHDFLDQYILNSYLYPNDFDNPVDLDYENKKALVNNLVCDPVLKRGAYLPVSWTLEKR